MLIPVPHTDRPLEKSSKGTILRRTAEDRYADMITKAYQNILPDLTSEVPDADIQSKIRQIVSTVVGKRGKSDQEDLLDDETDLFAYGVDSVGGIQIRHALSQLIPLGSALPLTVVEDQGTISRLTSMVLRIRSGESCPNGTTHDQDAADQHRLMLDLVQQYSIFNDPHPVVRPQVTATQEKQAPSPGLRIILTGPTGSLGSHILHDLLSNPSISHIHLLVRGSTQHASRERVLKALTSRLLPVVPENFASKTTIYQCKLSDPDLGLSAAEYSHLSCTVDVIVHLAWSVNFLLPLRTFAAAHLSGLRNLIDLALASPRPTPPRLIFCSSVASVSRYPTAGGPIPEAEIPTPSSSGPTGYARSKWVAEAICAAAHKSTRLRDRISISRVGQLSGASDTGVWNASEAYPLMLSSVKATGVLPDLKGEVLSWLPVDVAARAFVEDILSDTTPGPAHNGLNDLGVDVSSDITPKGLKEMPGNVQPDSVPNPEHNRLNNVDEDISSDTTTGTTHDHNRHKGNKNKNSTEMSHESDDIPVHHVLNPHYDVEWSDLLACLARRESFQVVSVDTWLSRLSALQDSADTKDHPALRLLGFWKSAYGVADPASGVPANHDPLQYEMGRTYERMPSLKADALKGVNEQYLLDLWEWIKRNV